MCGRFTLSVPAETLRDYFDLRQLPEMPPRYNIAPTQPVAIVRPAADCVGRALDMVRWGLIPAWADDPGIGARMINARAETVAEKPAFRAAFRQRRCLVPADGFYEWQKVGTRKQPHHIRLKNGGPFAIAGLWEHWRSTDGEVIESCTLITTEANDLLQPIHDRMPVILPPGAFDLWLDPAVADTRPLTWLLCPFPAEEMATYPVSPRVNTPANDGPDLIAPL
jgi:putative SOS response-associated peptidase YedK